MYCILYCIVLNYNEMIVLDKLQLPGSISSNDLFFKFEFMFGKIFHMQSTAVYIILYVMK